MTTKEKYRPEDVEVFVAERIVPALDANKKLGGSAELMSVKEENGEVAQFKMVDVLGKGASAKLCKAYARDSNEMKPLAIKRIDGAAFEGFEEDLENLLHRERRALRELKPYKHLVTEYYGYYYYAAKDEHWLAMEYCNGGSLFHLSRYLEMDLDWETAFPDLAKDKKAEILGKQAKDAQAFFTETDSDKVKTVNLTPIAAITAGILKGLEAIHEAGFIHGDIKSGNILLCYPGIVKICDFGLASKFKDEANPDLHALGTLDYMAPELVLRSLALDLQQPDADKFKYDYKVDVWALGAVVLELLLGRTALAEYRRSDEDSEEFQTYIANMCKHNRKTNMGSALGYFFYLPKHAKEVLKSVGIKGDVDKKQLLARFPILANNKKSVLKMLMRPDLYRKTPDPSKPVTKHTKVPQLFRLNKALDFIAQCLFIKPNMRPTAAAMRQHEFVQAASKELDRLEPSMDEITEMEKHWGDRKEMWKKHKMSLTVREIFKVLEAQKEYKKSKLLEGDI